MNKIIALVIVTSGLLAISLVAQASPVSKGHQKAEYTVVIDAPIKKVWEYNSINANASSWSVFFQKIVNCPVTTCPMNQGLQPSDIGFVRRAYRNNNEQGIFWDEETLEVVRSEGKIKKVMRAYNFHGYPMWYNNAEHYVEQFYTSIGPSKTQLTFRSQLYDNESLASPVSSFTYLIWRFIGLLGNSETIRIFKANLENIKAAIEQW